MLNRTFLHLAGVRSFKRERALWRKGILDWDTLAAYRRSLMPTPEPSAWPEPRWLAESQQALAEDDVDFFLDRIPPKEHFRLALHYPAEVAFLDIETTGLSLKNNTITLVGWSIGGRFEVYIAELDTPDRLIKAMAEAKALVTFNGKLFDVKFLEKEFPDIRLPRTHVDLRFLGQRVGLRGGQKAIEKFLGLSRPGDVSVGSDASALWRKFKSGDDSALRKLINYNHADVEGMKPIFDACVSRLIDHGELPPISELRNIFAPLTVAPGTWTRDGAPFPVVEFASRPRIYFAELNRLHSLKSLSVLGLAPLPGPGERLGAAALVGRRASVVELKNERELMGLASAVKPRLAVLGLNPVVFEGGESSGVRQAGRALADKLRSFGCAVIEALFPSVLEVLGVFGQSPGPAALLSNLRDYGLLGRLDAISLPAVEAAASAVFGQLFWAGKFEKSRLDDGSDLFSPDLAADSEPWLDRLVLAFSGPAGAGKTSAADYLSTELGFSPLAGLHALVDHNHTSPRKDFPQFVPGLQRPWESRQTSPCRALVVDGLTRAEEAAAFREAFGPAFVHCRIDRPSSAGGLPPSAADHWDSYGLADVTLLNDATLADLHDLTAWVVKNRRSLWL
ncbi:MAG: ribonuclease H-like domain-containing protein [Deltaproteobacteria bacterium]|jgi:uncharacterized protein YprB with RNaseH-like and TPR domain|nr:ribonuclease H-like domain-containing protein [Deltaproteobacteria bacterium]